MRSYFSSFRRPATYAITTLCALFFNRGKIKTLVKVFPKQVFYAKHSPVFLSFGILNWNEGVYRSGPPGNEFGLEINRKPQRFN